MSLPSAAVALDCGAAAVSLPSAAVALERGAAAVALERDTPGVGRPALRSDFITTAFMKCKLAWTKEVLGCTGPWYSV